MSKKSLLGLWCVLLLGFIISSAIASNARTARTQEDSGAYPQPRITQQIDPRAYVTLTGNTRPEAQRSQLSWPGLGHLPDGPHSPVSAALSGARAAVDKYINQLNDRNSPNFHKWLTPEEFGEKFGVADEDIQQVTNWLQSQGFQINQVYPNRMVIDFSGTAGADRSRLSVPR